MDTGQVKQETKDKIAGLFGPADEPIPNEAPPETPPGEEPPPAEAGAEPGSETPPAQPKDKEVEVEIDGEVYLVPEKISHRFIQHADYTRKTQDIAELRRVTTAQGEAYAAEKQFEQAVAPERRQAAILEAQIESFKTVDWSKYEAGDLMKLRANLDMLKDQRAEIETAIKTKRGEFDQRLGTIRAESIASGNRYIENHIPGFDQPKRQKLYTYGIREGYTNAEMDALIDPRIVVSLWKASQWDELQAQKPGVNKRASQAAPTIKPGAANRNQQANADAQYRKALQGAKSPAEKSKIVQKRLEDKLFGTAR